jgi:hypothetical protein
MSRGLPEMSDAVYDLNGEEQKILEAKVIRLKAITRSKVIRQDAIKTYTEEIDTLRGQSVAIISYMSKRFGLTRIQVINKILAENRLNL